jgi:cytochrome d ubiquinol oxidase subunit I
MHEAAQALLLAKVQFAFTISFHIIFPAFSIGLASYLAVLEGLFLVTKKPVFMAVYKYWLKIFAVVFSMGVVSGIMMSYQFGTNWSVFADKTSPVLGPLLGYEVMTAFFLESGFLGIMLFGEKRVGPKLHFLATALVAIGTAISAFWILSANSWMQTPAGFAMNDKGQFIAKDWFEVIFNPSFPYRLVHMLLAAYLTTAMVVGAVGAWHLLKDKKNKPAQIMFSMAMWMAALVAPTQLFVGDLHGLNTLEHQPAKVAAMEGHFEKSIKGAPLILFGVPDKNAEVTRHRIEIPKLGSLILTHDWDGEVKGLKAWPKEDRPNPQIIFWSFRIMVGIGLLMIALGVGSLILRAMKKLYDVPLFHRFAVLMGPTGFVAVLAGWITTEVGRQPFTVYGLLRTEHSNSPIDAAAISASLMAIVIVYLTVFGFGVFYIMRQMGKVPKLTEHGPPKGQPTRAAGITPAPALKEGSDD